MANPVGAKHLPITDYVRHESGALLPLPVQGEVIEEQQEERYLLKKEKDKEEEEEQKEMLEEENDEDAYDPLAAEAEVCYDGIPWRSDYEIWFGGTSEEGGEWTPPDAKQVDKKYEGKEGSAPPLPELAAQPTEKPQKEAKGKKQTGGKNNKRPSKRVPGSLGAVMELRQFDWNMVSRDFTVVAFGRRRSGKTFFMRDCLYHMRRCFPRGICITRTAINGFWQKMLPSEYIHDEVSEELLHAFFTSQKETVELAEGMPESLLNPYAFIIFEDCVDQHFRFNKTVEQLFYNGRHIKSFILVASQWCHSLHPGVRSNADIIIVFQIHSIAERQHIWETYFGFMPYEDFAQFLSRYTARRQIDGVWRHLFLGINNSVKSVSRTDAMFWGYAKETPNFIMGCEEYWGDELEKRHLKAVEKHERLKHLTEIP